MQGDRNQDYISLKEVISTIQGYIRFLLGKWKLIFMFGIVGLIIGFFYIKTLKPFYSGRLTFVLVNNSSKSNGLSGLIGQLGVDFGSSGGDMFTNSQNVLGLMASDKVLKKVLLKKIPGTNLKMVDKVAQDIGLIENLNNNEHLKETFVFPVIGDSLTIQQDSILRSLCTIVSKKYIDISIPGKKDPFYSVTTKSADQLIAIYLPRFIVDETAALYIETQTGQARRNYEMIKAEEDSLRSVLTGVVSSTSHKADNIYNLNPALQSQKSFLQEGQIKTTVLTATYSEVLKNLELAKINLQKETPLYQVIDAPEAPLVLQTSPKVKYLLMAVFLSVVLGSFYLILKKLYYHIMS